MKINFQLWQCLIFLQVFRKTAFNMLFNKLLFLNKTIDGELKYNIFKCTDFIYRYDLPNNLMSLVCKITSIYGLINNDTKGQLKASKEHREEIFKIYDELSTTAIENKLEEVVILFENNKNQFNPLLNIFENFVFIMDTLYIGNIEKLLFEISEDIKSQDDEYFKKLTPDKLNNIAISFLLTELLNEIIQDIVVIDENDEIKEYSHDIKLSSFKSKLNDCDVSLVTYNNLIESIVNYLNVDIEIQSKENDAVNMLNLLEDLKNISLN